MIDPEVHPPNRVSHIIEIYVWDVRVCISRYQFKFMLLLFPPINMVVIITIKWDIIITGKQERQEIQLLLIRVHYVAKDIVLFYYYYNQQLLNYLQ